MERNCTRGLRKKHSPRNMRHSFHSHLLPRSVSVFFSCSVSGRNAWSFGKDFRTFNCHFAYGQKLKPAWRWKQHFNCHFPKDWRTLCARTLIHRHIIEPSKWWRCVVDGSVNTSVLAVSLLSTSDDLPTGTVCREGKVREIKLTFFMLRKMK